MTSVFESQVPLPAAWLPVIVLIACLLIGTNYPAATVAEFACSNREDSPVAADQPTATAQQKKVNQGIFNRFGFLPCEAAFRMNQNTIWKFFPQGMLYCRLIRRQEEARVRILRQFFTHCLDEFLEGAVLDGFVIVGAKDVHSD